MDGFRGLERQGIQLTMGETVRVDLELAVGGLHESVTVTADASLLRGETGSLGQVVTQEKVQQLPLNGRSFISLAALAPGVALPPGSSSRASTADARERTSTCSTASRFCSRSLARWRSSPIIDAIQEFKIESNSPPAEFGRFNGGVINLTTKSGHEQSARHALRVLQA